MRKPLLRTLVWLSILLAGVALTRLANSALVVLGGLCIVVAPLFLIRAVLATFGKARLLAGRGLITRWQVSAQEWERFRAFDRERASQDAVLTNEFTFRPEAGEQGVEVIVGRRHVIVDGSYHVLRPRGIPELRGARWLRSATDVDCLEFAIAYPKKYGTTRLCLRIPVAANARDEARRALLHFESIVPRRQEALAYRKPMAVVVGGLIVSGLCLVVLVAGVVLRWQQVPVGAMLVGIGVMGGLFSLIFTAIIALATQPWRRR
ncbi:MAG TPA: hypothetical protein PKE27_22495 [Povalibacter sp.]|uniref:hypothetical protein n=1 Tax=Povalibacter sp. TaxID=1962978 RepID=UPI002B9E3A48|nr:hypothetical protein [Povalibacter sp.]HMN47362.1 hypothetical protein [Povalibacter sp.]